MAAIYYAAVELEKNVTYRIIKNVTYREQRTHRQITDRKQRMQLQRPLYHHTNGTAGGAGQLLMLMLIEIETTLTLQKEVSQTH